MAPNFDTENRNFIQMEAEQDEFEFEYINKDRVPESSSARSARTDRNAQQINSTGKDGQCDRGRNASQYKRMSRNAQRNDITGRNAQWNHRTGRNAQSNDITGRNAQWNDSMGRNTHGSNIMGRNARWNDNAGKNAHQSNIMGRNALWNDSTGRSAQSNDITGRNAQLNDSAGRNAHQSNFMGRNARWNDNTDSNAQNNINKTYQNLDDHRETTTAEGWSYCKPRDGALTFPLGATPADEDGYTRQDAFWTTGLKRDIRSWCRMQYYGVHRHLDGLDNTDENWLEGDIPEPVLPEVMSIHPRGSAKIEWRTVGNETGRQRLTNDLTKWGMKETEDYVFFDTDISVTCAQIQFKRPINYLLFLRMAGDYNILDPKNSKGWRLHPWDPLFQYVHSDAFVKPFIIEGLRATKKGPGNGQPSDRNRPHSTIDVMVNWELVQQQAEVLNKLNDYTLTTLKQYHEDNYQRYKRGEPLNPNIPSLRNVLKLENVDVEWLEMYRAKDYTAMKHRNDINIKNDLVTIPADPDYGNKANESSTERLDKSYMDFKNIVTDLKKQISDLESRLDSRNRENDRRNIEQMDTIRSDAPQSTPEANQEKIPIPKPNISRTGISGPSRTVTPAKFLPGTPSKTPQEEAEREETAISPTPPDEQFPNRQDEHFFHTQFDLEYDNVTISPQKGSHSSRARTLVEKAAKMILFLNQKEAKINLFSEKTGMRTAAAIFLHFVGNNIIKAQIVDKIATEVLERLKARSITSEAVEEKLNFAEPEMASVYEAISVYWPTNHVT